MKEVGFHILSLVYNIRVGGVAAGTCFFMPVNGFRYLVTAKHIIEQAGEQNVEIFISGEWHPIRGNVIMHSDAAIDIAAVDVTHLGAGPDVKVVYESSGIRFSGEVFFLGFPYGIQDMHGPVKGNPVPLARKAVLSGVASSSDGRPVGFYLDGYCNPGFSGGPCLMARQDGLWQVFGVVSGYLREQEILLDKDGIERMILFQNSGLCVCHSIDHMTSHLRSLLSQP